MPMVSLKLMAGAARVRACGRKFSQSEQSFRNQTNQIGCVLNLMQASNIGAVARRSAPRVDGRYGWPTGASHDRTRNAIGGKSARQHASVDVRFLAVWVRFSSSPPALSYIAGY